MKNVICFVIFCMSAGLAYSQEYTKDGNTVYPNGTVYLSNRDGVGQPPTLITPEGESVDLEEEPERFREILEDAADDAERRMEQNEGGDGKGFQAGPGDEVEFEEWMKMRGKWGSYPPIFFPQKGPSVPISNPQQWTNSIIRSLR